MHMHYIPPSCCIIAQPASATIGQSTERTNKQVLVTISIPNALNKRVNKEMRGIDKANWKVNFPRYSNGKLG